MIVIGEDLKHKEEAISLSVVNDESNIAKGTMDPRVEFCTPKFKHKS